MVGVQVVGFAKKIKVLVSLHAHREKVRMSPFAVFRINNAKHALAKHIFKVPQIYLGVVARALLKTT